MDDHDIHKHDTTPTRLQAGSSLLQRLPASQPLRVNRIDQHTHLVRRGEDALPNVLRLASSSCAPAHTATMSLCALIVRSS